jgi:hypothetical protein
MTSRGKEGWILAKGLVYSVEWIEPSRNDFGHYNVVFSYRAAGELYTGEFSDYGEATDNYLHKDDPIDILYNPDHPQQNSYPLIRTATNRRLAYFGIGAAIAIIVLLIVFLNGGFK